MKKSLIIILTLVMIFSTLPVYGETVVKNVGLGDEIDLDALLSGVTWDSEDFKASTKGVIKVTGRRDREDVFLYIVVGDKVPTISASEAVVNFVEKKATFSASVTGSSDYASIFVFKKTRFTTSFINANRRGTPWYYEAAEVVNGNVSFNVDLTEFDNGDYVAYIVSAGEEADVQFSYVNPDDFVNAVKAIPATSETRGQDIVDLCVTYAEVVSYDLLSVYSAMSNEEKVSVMEKIPANIAGYTGTVDLGVILNLFNEEVALYKLKTAADVTTILEDTVNPYAKALGVDVATGSYYKKIVDKTKFTSYFNSKDLSTKQNVQSAFYKGVGLTLVNEADNTNIQERLNNLDTINGVKALDITDELDDIKELDNELNQDDNVYKKVVYNAPYTETTDLKTKLQEFILAETGTTEGGTGDSSDDESGDDDDYGSGGGGGGSLGGGPSGGGLGALGGNSAIADAKEEENKEETPSKINAYSDIEDAEWARIYINNLSKLGVISGFDGKIRPNDPITKEEFAKLIVNAIGLTEKADNMKFSDVDPNEWYAEYISKLYKSGITTGVSATEFGTGTFISREDMAVLVHRAMKYINSIEEKSYEAETFADDSDISDYAKTAVYEIKALGIVNGVGENSFMPKGISSRAMAFKVISEAFYK